MGLGVRGPDSESLDVARGQARKQANLWSRREASSHNHYMGWLGRQLDAERPRWFLWLPVLFANGCLISFSLPREPSITEIFSVLVLAILVLALPRRSTVINVVGAIVLGTVSGFVAAKLRTVEIPPA